MGVVAGLTSWHEDTFSRLQEIINAPEKFVAPDAVLQSELRSLLKTVYDQADGLDQYGPLPELVVDGLDAEQIWEELELRTEPLLDRAAECVANCQAVVERTEMRSADDARNSNDDNASSSCDTGDEQFTKDGHSEKFDSHDDEEIPVDVNVDSDDDDHDKSSDDGNDDSEEEDDDEDGDVGQGRAAQKQRACDGLNDDFFNAEEMEGFADHMEMVDDNDDAEHSDNGDGSDDDDEVDDEEPVDLLHDIEGDSGAQYSDMFDDLKRSSKADANDDDEFADLSEFKKRQRRLQKEIEQLEERNLQGRSWELMGEVRASDRPADALIDAPLDFEMADKQPQLITQEVTNDLEELIRQRVKDRAYDDVERKAEPVAKPFRARSELETEKSEVGLAELYEKEYVEKATGVTEAEEQLSKEHKEIASMFAALCYKLDALSNFHFTPKPAREEVVVRKNVPAIAMEEAIPVAVSSAQSVAPEEVYKPAQHEPVADTELSRDEKKARRRSKKEKNRKEREQKVAEDDLRAKYDARFKAKRDKKLALQEIKANSKIKSGASEKTDAVEYTRSGSFFQKIQEAESHRGRTDPNSTKSKTTQSSLSFKL